MNRSLAADREAEMRASSPNVHRLFINQMQGFGILRDKDESR